MIIKLTGNSAQYSIDFGEPLNFTLVPPTGQSEISYHLLLLIGENIHGSQMVSHNNLVILWIFFPIRG